MISNGKDSSSSSESNSRSKPVYFANLKNDRIEADLNVDPEISKKMDHQNEALESQISFIPTNEVDRIKLRLGLSMETKLTFELGEDLDLKKLSIHVPTVK